MPKGLDLIGQRFGKLTVVRMGHRRGRVWYCVCDCGKEKEKPLTSYELRAGKRLSCGTLVSLDKIETLAIKMGAKGYEVRAYLPGDPEQTGFYVLFSHADRAVCEEWLDRFAEEYLDVLQPVVLMRDCPQCSGRGTLPIGPDGADETCSFCEGERRVTLEVYESTMREWGLKP